MEYLVGLYILDCTDLSAPHISIKFNSSLANGIFLDNFGQGERSDIDKYRPISVHSTVTALLEATNNWAYNIDIGTVMLTLLFFLTLRKSLTQSITISYIYCLNYISVV